MTRLNRRRGRSSSIQITSRRAGGGEPEPPPLREETIRFWWSPPDRLREETTSNWPGQTRTTILNGELWWLYGEPMGAITNELLDAEQRANHHAGGGDEFRALLDPSWLIPAIELDDIRAGDGVLHVDARLRDDIDGPRLFPLHLVGGADRFELEVDAELGIVRATTSYLDGKELSSLRFDDLALGEPLDDGLFTRPPDVEFEAPGGHAAEVTLEQAAAEAPFAVFFVPDLPEGIWRLRAHRMRRPTYNLWLVYHRSDGRESFSLGQSTELLFEPADDDEHAVAFERDGTKILLQSDTLDRHALLDIAASLRRFRNG